MICQLIVARFFCLVLVSVITFQVIVSASKDRFNIYKGADVEELSDLLIPEQESKISYFYRTPQLGGIGSVRMEQTPVDFGKRTINRFKNYMLATKDNPGEEEIGKSEIDSLFG